MIRPLSPQRRAIASRYEVAANRLATKLGQIPEREFNEPPAKPTPMAELDINAEIVESLAKEIEKKVNAGRDAGQLIHAMLEILRQSRAIRDDATTDDEMIERDNIVFEIEHTTRLSIWKSDADNRNHPTPRGMTVRQFDPTGVICGDPIPVDPRADAARVPAPMIWTHTTICKRWK